MLIFFFHPFSNQNIFIGKSNFPVWDLFEFSFKDDKQIHFFNYNSYIDIHENYINQTIDGAMSTIYEVILSSSKGAPVKIVSILDYTSGADILLSQSRINNLIGLKGRTIGVEFGTISHFTALKALEMAGLEKEDVKFVFKSMLELIEDFKLDKIDVISTFEPFATEILQNQGVNKLFSSKQIPRKICDVFYINPNRISDDKVINKFSKSWLGTSKEALVFPQKIQKKMNEFYKKTNVNYTFSLDGIRITGEMENKIAFSENGYLIQALFEMMEFMYAHGVIKNKVDVTKLF